MQTFYSDIQQRHDPTSFIRSGAVQPSPECPERARRFLAAVTEAGHPISEPASFGLAPVAAIHPPDYLRFLETAHARWQELPGAGPEVIANIHPGRHMTTRPAHITGEAGFFMADTACPIGAGTWEAVQAAADCAVAAMAHRLEHGAPAYALCRPPGHHAYADMAGGFCFLNNVAIAAQYAVDAGLRAAVLDIDVHHGNGTQGIFYQRKDVLTVSVHADPSGYYPFYAGYADERGAGLGQGFNLNLPQAHGSGDETYLSAIAEGLAAIRRFSPDITLIALGLDPQENDPLGVLKITTEGFRRAGALIGTEASVGVIVQEGGYLCDELGANLAAFLTGFEGR